MKDSQGSPLREGDNVVWAERPQSSPWLLVVAIKDGLVTIFRPGRGCWWTVKSWEVSRVRSA